MKYIYVYRYVRRKEKKRNEGAFFCLLAILSGCLLISRWFVLVIFVDKLTSVEEKNSM